MTEISEVHRYSLSLKRNFLGYPSCMLGKNDIFATFGHYSFNQARLSAPFKKEVALWVLTLKHIHSMKNAVMEGSRLTYTSCSFLMCGDNAQYMGTFCVSPLLKRSCHSWF